MAAQSARPEEMPVASVLNAQGGSPVVLVCEHASNFIPAGFNRHGLSSKLEQSHIAWDPGAKLVSQHMSDLLGAPLVVSEVSRLVYDCNRPPDAPDAMPEKSELFDIPGNAGLNAEQKEQRVKNYYRPFEEAVAATLAKAGADAILVTIHSFTPVYHGKQRQVELGILHDEDSRLAGAMMQTAPTRTSMKVRYNEPYGAEDGVTHTLKVHGIKNGILNVMIEIRNDLVSTPAQCRNIAELLASLLRDALPTLQSADQIKRTGT